MSPKLQPKISRSESPQRRSNHLRLVVNQKRPSPNLLLLRLGLSAILAGFLGVAWHLGGARRQPASDFSSEISLVRLTDAFQTGGIEGYLLAKARLREQVRKQLATPESLSADDAEHLAVLLFPELLPEWNFEKKEAQELFRPQIEVIESQARSEAAREAFDSLRADLWNYENASREEPQLSRTSAQLLELFSVMSRD